MAFASFLLQIMTRKSRYPYVIAVVCGALLFGCRLFGDATGSNPLAPEMMRVEGGTFMMGDIFEGENEDALPVHRVEVQSLSLSRYEITYEQYDAFAHATGRPLPPDGNFGRGNRAVTYVTWDDAAAFCAYYGYRLPTEAEWEYAARAGGREQIYAGTDDADSLAVVAFVAENSPGFSAPVGLKKANALGLHDMSGNVSEWVGAYYEKYPRPGEKPVYKDLSNPGIRVARGGSFTPAEGYPGPTEITRTYWRAGALNDMRSPSIGFRCAD